ncbi:Nramp family divalent metal transporter [Actinoplanes subtropicus]|uniref:Nramp family divalent metal transporter n=1 Tax=Actinoplanes subtropicus TaxID=543632 RepID=UPI0009FD7355|nr:Nramp family divalent metal transporter [Actinoplanes subtropicus]
MTVQEEVQATAWPTEKRGRSFNGGHLVRLMGPAFVASIAYVDPGNVATNLTAGARYGFLLVWVLLLANIAAVVAQYLSAKLGIVTGRSLPEQMRARLSGRWRLLYWAQAEVTIVATEVAEVIGGALALRILFGLPLVLGGLIVGAVSFGMLALQSRRRQRTFEAVLIGMLAVIVIGFTSGLAVSHVDWLGALGGVAPRFSGTDSVLLAAAVVGATVMPHAIYAHSSLARDRHCAPGVPVPSGLADKLLRATRWDVGSALAVAGSVNLAMLLLAAAALRGIGDTDTLQGAASAMTAHIGAGVGLVFAVGLLASGLASTTLGGYAGSEIMAGLLKVSVPVITRRVVTIIPALVVLATGVDPSRALVLSQVVLSIGIPLALIPLIRLTADREVMGSFANRAALRIAGTVVALGIVTLNLLLLVLTLKG